MANFKGISPEAIELLAQNRFHDSKPFYEEHKEELKRLTTNQMRCLMVDLSDTLLKIDREMNVDPTWAVSRIRRDTRFSKNKTLYREHMWIMFRRKLENRYDGHPALWFEFMPGEFTCGVGYMGATPTYMEHWRKRILERPGEVLVAIRPLLRAGLTADFETYKRPKEGSPQPGLLPFYQAKQIFLTKHSTDMELLNSPALVEELRKIYIKCKAMYQLLLELHFEVLLEE